MLTSPKLIAPLQIGLGMGTIVPGFARSGNSYGPGRRVGPWLSPARPRRRIPPLAPGEGDAQTAELLAQLDPNVGAVQHLHHPRPPPRAVPEVVAVRREAAGRQAAGAGPGAADPAHRMAHARPSTSGASTCASPWPAGSPTPRWSGSKAGPDDPAWDPFDAALLRATDELHDDGCITDATWATLADRYTTQQLIEVPMVVGQYHLVGFTLNSLGVAARARASSASTTEWRPQASTARATRSVPKAVRMAR